MKFRLRYQQHNLELVPGQFVIGRSTDCQLSVDDPLVSRRHARLIVSEEGIYLEDLGSRNGVLLDGKRIDGRVKLGHGDRITVGSQEMTVLEASGNERAVTGQATNSAFTTYAGPLTATELPALASVSPQSDEQSRKADAFRLLGGVADKALAMGKADEAERILSSLLNQLLETAKSGKPVPPEVTEQAGRYAARLASATGKGSWCDYVVELYLVHQRVLPATIVDELYSVLRKAQGASLTLLRLYVSNLKSAAGSFGPNERFLLQRIEGLEKVVAWK